MKDNSKTFAIVGLILGIVACAIAWWHIALGIVAIICAIIGLIFSIKATKAGVGGLATAALILCIIGLVLAIIGTIACGICACVGAAAKTAVENGELGSDLSNMLESAANEIATEISNAAN